MLEVLDHIADTLRDDTYMGSLWKQIESLWETRGRLTAATSATDGIFLLRNHDEVLALDDDGQWLVDRENSEDEAAGREVNVVFQHGYTDGAGQAFERGQVATVGRWWGGYLVKAGLVRAATKQEESDYEAGVSVPSVGDDLRLASMLHGNL